MSTLSRLVSRLPALWVALFVLVTVAIASNARNIEIEPDIKAMLPADYPERVDMDKIDELFGGTDFVMVTIEADDVLAADTLKRIKALTRKFERVKGIDQVISLTSANDIRSEDGTMVVERAVKRIPRTPEQRAALRKALEDNDMLIGNVVAEDFKSAAMICQLKTEAPDHVVLAGLNAALEAVPGPETVNIGGGAFMRTEMATGIASDMRKLLPLGLLIMLVFLFVCFRQLRGVLLPFIVVVMSIGLAMGLVPLLGWKLQLVTVLLPVILIAVANDYGIHIVARYQEEIAAGHDGDKRRLIGRVVGALTGPVVVTGITTIAGLLCMLSHVLVPAREVGVLASVGVAWALAGSLLFIPAVLVLLPLAKPLKGLAEDAERRPLLDRGLGRVARVVAAAPGRVLGGVLVTVCAVGLGALLLTIEMNVINFFPADSALVKSTLYLNEHYGGSMGITAVAKGDIKDPKVLRQMEALEKRLLELPQVEEVTSIASVVRRMNEAIGDGDEDHRIPETREQVAELFLLYSMSGDPTDFDRMVDFPYEHALLNARIASLSTADLGEVGEVAEAFSEAQPDSPFTLFGGFARLLSSLVHALVIGQIWSLGLSLLIVTALVALLFRSIAAGLLAFAPLAAAMATLFGLMGLFGVELNHITALLSSIMIGVGVDYTIHFLWRYRDERAAGREPADAVYTTLTTTGRGIVFNALSVIVGFAVLLVSGFLPVKWFGFLVSVSIAASLIGALVVAPAIALKLRPRFLEPAGKRETQPAA